MKADILIIGGGPAGLISGVLAKKIILKKGSFFQLAFSQFATHPLLTPAPTVYPLISASLEVLGK